MKIYRGQYLWLVIYNFIILTGVTFLFYRLALKEGDWFRTYTAIVFLTIFFFVLIYFSANKIVIYKNHIGIKNELNPFSHSEKVFYFEDIKMIKITEFLKGDTLTVYLQNGKKKIYSTAIPKLDNLQRDLEERGVKVKRGW